MVQDDPTFAALDRQRLQHLQRLGLELNHFFDVGASNGAWTRHIRLDFPEATFDLFEPLADLAPGWRERIESSLVGPKFRLHKVALGPRCGRTKMHVFQNDPSGSTALAMETPPQDTRQVEVEMLTLDDAVRQGGGAVPQVIKIDTQGCELEILRGAPRTLPEVQVLVLECWLVRDYGKSTPLLLEVAQWLREFDFHLWDFGDQWRNSDGILTAQDCLFLNARCRISRLEGEPRRSSGAIPPSPAANGRDRWKRVRDLLAGKPDETATEPSTP